MDFHFIFPSYRDLGGGEAIVENRKCRECTTKVKGAEYGTSEEGGGSISDAGFHREKGRSPESTLWLSPITPNEGFKRRVSMNPTTCDFVLAMSMPLKSYVSPEPQPIAWFPAITRLHTSTSFLLPGFTLYYCRFLLLHGFYNAYLSFPRLLISVRVFSPTSIVEIRNL